MVADESAIEPRVAGVRPQLIVVRVLANAGIALPLVILVFTYATWVLAWLRLGRQPVPIDDDPKTMGTVIHGLTNVIMNLGEWWRLGLALALGSGANLVWVAMASTHRPKWVLACVRLGSLLLAWGILMSAFQLDPFRVMEWVAD